MTDMPGESYSAPLPALSAREAALQARLKRHVTVLAEEIGERHIWHSSTLEDAADYIESTLHGLNYNVASQHYVSEGVTVRNLAAEITGGGRPEEIILIGAHYDTVPGSPGANDNASGVAALLEIARLLTAKPMARSVRFVAFANEEPPFFYSEQMGSRVYARSARERGDQIVAMISLETIGYYDDSPDSQHYPNPIYSLFYPDTGNFLAFVGNLSSRKLVRQCVRTFRSETDFPSEGVAAPGWLGGVHWSDHWSFWREGYPALMVTDTALFRYRRYHTGADTPDQLDYERLARVTMGLARLVVDLAQEEMPHSDLHGSDS